MNATSLNPDDTSQMTSKTIWAEQALTGNGWMERVRIRTNENGRIEQITAQAAPEGSRVGVLLPAVANLHSHAFQRAMAGLTERAGPQNADGLRDNFWSWRTLMYRFLEKLGPDEIEAISAFVYMEMLEAGYGSAGEFHYLHHQPNGSPFANLAETSERICAAAGQTGIGLTLLPVLYQRGGCDDRALSEQQRRFGNDTDRFSELVQSAGKAVKRVSSDCIIGVAPHSLRAVPEHAMQLVADLVPDAPVHIHIAEQTAENEEVRQATGQTPVQWLLENCQVDNRWCLVHATHMTDAETVRFATSGAVAGLCPITEANLGDGIFNGSAYLQAGGKFGVGSDSNVRISLSEELKTLEYSQRLKERARAVLTNEHPSNGRELFMQAATGGAQALGRGAGTIAVGELADLTALDSNRVELTALRGDYLLDSAIFAGDDSLVTDVWSAGRHVVTHGQHINRGAITTRYRSVLEMLRQSL